MNAKARITHKVLRPATLGLALIGTGALASDDFSFNLMQYEFTFGQGRTQHAFYMSTFAPGGRFDEFAFGESPAIRMPLFSTDEKRWTLMRAASDVADGGLAGNIASGILALGTLAAMGYAVAAQVKGIGDAFDFDITVPTQNLTVPSATSASSPRPAKK